MKSWRRLIDQLSRSDEDELRLGLRMEEQTEDQQGEN